MAPKPSTSLRRSLVDVAMGRRPADLVIHKGKWVSVQSGEIIPDTDVAIVDGHIAFVGELSDNFIIAEAEEDVKWRFVIDC